MLFLQLSLLLLLFPGGDNEDAFQKPITFHINQITYIYNHTCAGTLISGWLDELQTHGWESDSGTTIFLWPWSRGNFSNKELRDTEQLFYPSEILMMGGCELHSGETTTGFLRAAYQGSDFLSFQNNSWVPSPASGIRAQSVCSLLNQYQGIKEIVHGLLSDICPRFMLGILDAGKAYLQRQVRPQAWLSRGRPPGPGRLLLVCHVSGFYPKPVWVMWMRGEQEQPSTRQGDVLPNADGTWYLRVSLDVAAGEAAGLSCRVRHSSLDGQDIILYWEHHSSKSWIFLAVILPLVLLTGLVFWLRKRWSYQKTQRASS
ncbi:T-cell surface glycoprotein CD1a isoform X2 [Choloepus didactylus]|uniref:T-cell surface glycoprotein CD1a isoform X2 n=1 Tax=Choloepus didactylus TaxID=27675 RepID=UPI00189DF11F|nr:T-cell surface glycoprotein CD1a isoform X2 [Choloepus didactylus]